MYSITKNGQCAKHLCVIDEKAKSVSTTENSLVFDFSDGYGWSFKTGHSCTFDTSYGCTFKTGSSCIFKTGSNCTFNTGSLCTFDTGDDCTFKIGFNCTFKIGSYCTFNTGYGCTFKGGENCVVVRRDVFETFVLPENKTVVLNGFEEKGYTIQGEKKKVTLELTDEQIEGLRKQGIDI